MNNFGRIIAIILIIIIVAIALLTGANILFFWSIFGFIEYLIRSITGMESNLAKAFAALAVSLIVILPVGKMLRSFSPFPQKHKKIYRALVFFAISIFFLFAYLGRRDLYFDPYGGNALKYYSETNGLYTFYDSPGFDPVTGDRLRPVTKEVVLRSKGLFVESPNPADEKPIAQDTQPGQAQSNVQELSSETDGDLSMDEKPFSQAFLGAQVQDQPPSDEEADGEQEVSIERGQSKIPCRISNCTAESLIITNLDTREKQSVPAHRTQKLMLEPGRYDAEQYQKYHEPFEVIEGGSQEFEFLNKKVSIEREQSKIPCWIRNFLGKNLIITNLDTREKQSVPAHSTHRLMLEPGRYKAEQYQKYYETFEVIDGGSQEFEFLMVFQSKILSRRGRLICDNTGLESKLIVTNTVSSVEKLVVGPNMKDSIVLFPGHYTISGIYEGRRFSDRFEIEANKTYVYESKY